MSVDLYILVEISRHGIMFVKEGDLLALPHVSHTNGRHCVTTDIAKKISELLGAGCRIWKIHSCHEITDPKRCVCHRVTLGNPEPQKGLKFLSVGQIKKEDPRKFSSITRKFLEKYFDVKFQPAS